MTASAIERVQVVLEAIVNRFGKSMDYAQQKINQVGKNIKNFGQVMKMPMDDFKTLNSHMKVVKTSGGRLARGIRMMTHGMQKFRMEMLGVMFFGMMLQKTFMNLLQPVMEAYGVMDLFRLMLLTLFLPVMDMIFPYLLTMMEWFMNLPEPVKKVLGVLTILGVIFGTILFYIGALNLGIGSIIKAFPIMGSAFQAIGSAISALTAPILIFAAIIVAIAIGIWLAWKENFGNIRDWVSLMWGGIKQIFKGAIDVIMGLVNIFTSLFKGDIDGISQEFKRFVNGMKNIWSGFINFIIGLLVTLGLGVLRALKGIVVTVYNIGRNIVTGLIDGIKSKSLTNKVKNAILGLFPEWARNMIWSIDIFQNATKKVKSLFGFGDFIWRPGQSPISINPNDTLVGFKGATPTMGGGSIVQNNNYYGFTKDELKRELDDRDRRLVDEVRRLVKT